jgi:hypothetical protein
MKGRWCHRFGTWEKWASLFLFAAAWLLASAIAADAGTVGLWRFETAAGSATPNDALGGAPGILANGASLVTDSTRGSVLETDGNDDFVRGGVILPLDQTTSDFTWAFWAKQNPGQPVNSEVIVGSRWNVSGGDTIWSKFTPAQFEYRHAAANNTIDYANIASDDVWHHYAVVKSGTTLTHYRDGAPAGTGTVSGTMGLIPFYMGGDAVGERWQGRLDDVLLVGRALSQTEVQQVGSGNFSSVQSPGHVALNDRFPGPSVNTSTWNVIEKGLQTQGAGTAGTVAATINADEQLVISGTAGGTPGQYYWGGRTLQSTQTFDSGLTTTFSVDRLSLTGSGSAYRSSIWIWGDDQHFLHFSQNRGENGWQYNWNDVGGLGGNPAGGAENIPLLDALDADAGAHGMMLVYRPTGDTSATIEMYLDGQIVASQNFTNWSVSSFRVLITGQARTGGDTVNAVFDNALVTAVPEPATLAMLIPGAACLAGLAIARRRRRA